MDRPGGRGGGGALILAGERPFDGPVTLTAPGVVTFEEIVEMASEVTGREIRRVVVDDEEWVAGLVAHGTPEPMARLLLGGFLAMREGLFAQVDSLLGDLLGREPRTVRELLADRTG